MLPAAALLMLTGCTDDSYDLDNLDKTVGVKITDLVVPVNLGNITMNSVFDLDDTESISKEMYEGKEIYVFNRSGNYTSDEIHINSFHVNRPSDLSPTNSGATMRGIPSSTVEYDLEEMTKHFTYEVRDVDSKVVYVNNIETPGVRLSVSLRVPDEFMQHVTSITYKNMVFEFPKNLKVYGPDGTSLINATSNIGNYNASTGELTISEYTSYTAETTLYIDANYIDMGRLENINNAFDYENTIQLKSGEISFISNNPSSMPGRFDFYAYYDLPAFDIDYFTGKINYEIEGLSFDPVNLDDMPDILNNEGTRVRIANPQLYFNLVNTCAPYDLGGDMQLELLASRPTGDIPYLLPENIVVNDGEEDAKFAISPEGENLKSMAEGYDAANGTKMLKFTELSDLLYGNDEKGYGIPSAIDVNFINPTMKGVAKRFPLERAGVPGSGIIQPITGSYLFKAPLAPADGSVIVYSGDNDSWDSDFFKDLRISSLTVTTTASSELPLDVNLSAHLINSRHEHIGICEMSQLLKANASNEDITITILPSAGQEYITDIIGIYYEAIATQNTAYPSPADVPIISPDMTIKLENLRGRVDGEYVTTLDDDDDNN